LLRSGLAARAAGLLDAAAPGGSRVRGRGCAAAVPRAQPRGSRRAAARATVPRLRRGPHAAPMPTMRFVEFVVGSQIQTRFGRGEVS
jgi:hypothetical protein